jgi:hypothetical protein
MRSKGAPHVCMVLCGRGGELSRGEKGRFLGYVAYIESTQGVCSSRTFKGKVNVREPQEVLWWLVRRIMQEGSLVTQYIALNSSALPWF